MRVEVTGEKRKLHSEELNNLYSSPSIVRVTKSRRMWWAGHVARMREEEAFTGFWWENLSKREHLVDSGVDGSIILKWVFRKWVVEVWTGLSWLKIETDCGHL
jgi:hypothetical protein